jgi:hypothetical protein
MAGTPKKRARRQAAAASDKQGSPARARKSAAKPKAAPKRPARQRVRASFEAATPDDYAAVVASVEAAAVAHARKKDGRLTPEDRVERDAGIIAAHALSMSPSVIAEKFGMTDHHVRIILAAHRDRRGTLPKLDGRELLEDALEALEAQMERLSLLASKEGNAAAATVGAIRTWREMWLSRLDLLVLMGRIDTQPSREQRDREAHDKLRELLAHLRDAGVPDDVLRTAAEEVLLPAQAGANVRAIEAAAR